MDVVVVILVLGAFAVLIFKRFSKFVYYVAMIDILLRILAFLSGAIPVPVISDFFATYFPNSVSHIIDIYSSGIFNTVLSWLLVANYVAFEWFLIKTFFKKK